MVKRLLFFLIALIFFQLSEAYSQISIGMVDPGPYTPGSSIAATFSFGTICINPGNRFDLYLVRPDGTEIATPIGSYNGFYSTFVNGIIPNATIAPPALGYSLRIKSTNPALVSNPSATFEIRAGDAITAQVDSRRVDLAVPDAFGFCAPRRSDAELSIENQSTPGGIVTAQITNELTPGSTSLSFGTPIQSFTPDLAHYTMLVKVVMPNGSIATRAYFIINNPTNIAFRTTTNGVVCLPEGTFVYGVETSNEGIGLNFPGNLYRVNWGDNLVNYYTLCQLKSGVVVEHKYTTSSCGRNYYDGNTTHYNVFGVNISMESPLCGITGSSLSTYAKVIHITENRFSGPEYGCINTSYTFDNNSITGENPSSNTPGCEDPAVRYNWYLNGNLVATNRRRSEPYIFPATATPGLYTIRLTSTGGAACPSVAATRTICIQAPPRPAFDIIGPTTGCAPFPVSVQDNSILDLQCTPQSNYTYNWIVTDGNGIRFTNFQNGIQNPQFNFTIPGVYTIALEITSGSCAAVRTVAPEPIVIINGPAVAVLSPDKKLCTLGTYRFNDTPNTPTTTTLTGTQVRLADTYTWEVTNATNGNPLTSADYTFEDNTGPNTKDPAINFKSNIAYKVTVTHKNTCNPSGVTDSQILEFFPAPVINAGNDQSICFTQNAVQLNATNSGIIRNQRWVGGLGTFSDRSDPDATYIPTLEERNSGVVVLNFSAETDLAEPCSTVTDEVRITIKKEILVTSNRTKSICSDTKVDYTPTSNLQNTTYTWTATGSTNADGFSSGSGTTIADQLTNSDPLNPATVIYTIIPENDRCVGDPFTFTVTVNPIPVVTATPAKPVICSGKPVAIELESLPGTKYTWSSVATNGPTNTVTGNTSNMPTPSAITLLNDLLINNGTAQGNVTYLITPYSNEGCVGATVSVTVNIDPALTVPDAGIDESICNLTTHTLKGNRIDVGTGTWSLVSGQTGVLIANPNSENSGVTGLIAGQRYTFHWTVTSPGSCSTLFNDVDIVVNTPTVAGTTATADPVTVCESQNTGTIILSGNTGSVTRWESLATGETVWNPITNTTTTHSYTNLTTTTQFRAVVQNGRCDPANSTPLTITVTPATTIANAGPNQTLCDQLETLLDADGTLKPGEIGRWSVLPSTTILEPTNPKSRVTGLITGQTYTFTWTITGNSPCGPSSSQVTVINNPPISQSISSTIAEACHGQQVVIDGSVPTGGSGGNYLYSWEMKVDAGNWATITGEANEDLTITLTTSGAVSFKRTVTSGGCTSTSAEYLITVRPPITANNITADQTICSGMQPANPLTGQPPQGGGGTFTYQWQSSTDEQTWTNIGGANDQGFQSTALTTTTFYRRAVSTLACSGALQSISNVVKITVNPNAEAEFTWGASDTGCAPFALPITAVPYPDRNAIYTWYAGDRPIGTGVTFPGYTITKSNEQVNIRLVVTSSLGCTRDEFPHVFSTIQAVPASFTQSKNEGCGPLLVNFTNTSVLTAGATFLWDFGNGATSTQANPGTVSYEAEATGKDTTYVITLTATTSCGSNSITSTVLVKAKPIAIFSPSRTDGCSPMTVNFTNTSPGGAGTTYYYDFGDGTAVVSRNDKSPVQHVYNTMVTTTFRATLTVLSECGTDIRAYNIRVAPQNITPELVVDAGEKEGCAPHTVNFDNNSIGASRFTFDFGDGSPIQTTLSTGKVPYTYTRPGTFTITMTAYNSCSEITTTETVTVLPQPLTEFEADNTLGCPGLTVKFKNNTQNGVSYRWDFGDGSPISNEFEPTHTYTGDQEYYTVTLTATNNLGCTMAVTKNQYIHIVQPPVAAFNVNPSTLINIPDYTFRFEDESTNTPTIWEWDFGDGTGSALKNPSHTYLDTGTYKVTLKVINQQGCFTSTFKNVTIKGVPGYLFVPNSFVPGNTQPELREFRAKGSGMATWRFSIFNKWGQLLWETTKLEEGRPVEGWDGTFKGQQLPQGVYYWKVDVQMVNGSEWKGMTYDSSAPKRTGAIHLIR